LILVRILQKLHLKNESPFNEIEETQLQNLFQLNTEQLHSVLNASAFIFEQCAYVDINPDVLAFQLEKSGVNTQKIGSFVQVWKEGSSDFLSHLKDKSIMPLELGQIGWQLHLQIGQTSLKRMKEPAALFDLQLKSPSESIKGISEHIQLEFTTSELNEFFKKLETIQEQLDNLQ